MGAGRKRQRSIWANGSLVAFESEADNLSGADVDFFNIFVHDRKRRKTRLVSRPNNGAAAVGLSELPFPGRRPISFDGRFVGFVSDANNIAPLSWMMYTRYSLLMPKTVAEQIADQLRSEILAGLIPPGTRLFQDVEAARLEVSRTPLREAIRQLEGERLVQIIPNRGAVVTRLTREEVAEIYEIRGQLEPLAAAQAARLSTPEEVRAIGALLEELEEARTQRRIRRLLELNKGFHFQVYEASRMPRLVNIISSLWGPIEAMRAAYASEPVTARHAAHEHSGLYRAIRDRDEKEAAAVTRRHVETMAGAVLGWMEAAPPEGGGRGLSDEDPAAAGQGEARHRGGPDGPAAVPTGRETG